MRSTRALVLLVAALAGPMVVTGCRSSNAYDIDAAEPDHATLVVKNDNFLDVDVYAVSSGLATRVGSVSGLTTKQFALASTLYTASDFRIVATPIGGNGRASTGALMVHGGQTVEFTIGTRLASSHASIREP